MGYLGISAGAAFPLANTNAVQGVGPHITATLGVNSPTGILGLRVDGTYTLLRGKNVGNGFSSNQLTFPDYSIATGGLNGVIRAPFGFLASSGFYIFGGGGIAHARSFVQSDENRFRTAVGGQQVGPEQNLTRAFWNGGAGLDIGRRSRGALFLEGRFMQILTPGERINMVPVTIGTKF
jgi:opacity protein-like surface antigen